MLTPVVEPLAHRCIRQRLVNTEGVFVHEIGGTETHVHVVVTVSPTITPSELVGQLKGASSHDVNQQIGLRDKTLQWQSGYGVTSFGTGDLEISLNSLEDFETAKPFIRKAYEKLGG